MSTDTQTWHVASVAALKSAISGAQANDRIVIAGGDYSVTDVNGIVVDKSLTFASEGGLANFHADVPMRKGIFTVLNSVESTTIDGLGFYDARNGDLNGAGIRHQGGDLTVLNSYFSNNQDGILAFANTGFEGNVVIARSEFDGNGWVDGRAHGIYVYSDSLTVEDSHFHDTVVGHHIKSVAASNVIRGNTLDDAGGNASRALDVTGGGDLRFEDNTVTKAAASQNSEFILYDDYRTAVGPGDVVIDGNTFTSHRGNAKLLINSTDGVPTITDNAFANVASSRLVNGEVIQSGNIFDGLELPPTGGSEPSDPLLLSETFDDGNAAGWTAVDQGTRQGPSSWKIVSGEAHQGSNINNDGAPATDPRLGTMLVWDDASARDWSDYTLESVVRSTDNDGIGLAFYYTDADNYYQLDLGHQRGFSSLVQVADGVQTTLATASGPGYAIGTDVALEISVSDAGISVLRDGADLFGGAVQGGGLDGGTVALYAWANNGANFDDITVRSNDPGPGMAVLSIAAADAAKPEGDGGPTDFTFAVTRSGNTDGAATVDYAVTGAGLAPADASDFEGTAFPLAGQVSFAAGEVSQDITVRVAGDDLVEFDETFLVSLSNAGSGAMIARGSATGTIQNDDAALPAAPSTLLLSDSFDDGNLDGWAIADDGTRQGPSSWKVASGEAHQGSNINNDGAPATDPRLGTMLVWDDPAARDWSDYTLEGVIRSTDNDGIGLALYYTDADNYYQLDLGHQQGFSSLVQVADGVKTTLATATGPGYGIGADVGLEISVSDAGISVLRDGQDLFDGAVQGGDLDGGTVALFSWANTGANFDDIAVTANGAEAKGLSSDAAAGYSLADSGSGDAASLEQVVFA